MAAVCWQRALLTTILASDLKGRQRQNILRPVNRSQRQYSGERSRITSGTEGLGVDIGAPLTVGESGPEGGFAVPPNPPFSYSARSDVGCRLLPLTAGKAVLSFWKFKI